MERVKRSYSSTVAVIYLCMFLEGAGNILIASTKTSLMESFGIGLDNIGFILMVNSVFCGLLPMISGGLSDKYGRKIVIATGAVLFFIFYFCVPIVNSYPLLVLLAAMQGVAYCCTDPSAQAVLFDTYDDATPKMPFVQLAFASGAFTAPILIGAIYDNHMGWELSYFAYGIMYIILFALVISRKFPPRAGNKNEAENLGKVTFKKEPKPLREGLIICVYIVIYALATGFLSRWVDVFMMDVFGYENAAAVKTMSVYQVGCITGALLNLFISKRFHVTKLLVAYPLVAFIAMCVGVFGGNGGLFIAALFISGLVLGTLFSLSVGLMGRLFWKNAGAATGFISSSSAAGLALSSLIAGSFVDIAGIYFIFIAMLVLMAVTFLLGLVINRLYGKLV